MTEETRVVMLAALAEDRAQKIRERDARHDRHAAAYLDLEPAIRDLERAAKIAHRMFIDTPDEEDIELGIFAVEQFHKMATDLVRLYYKTDGD
jgi:hypothetical protein